MDKHNRIRSNFHLAIVKGRMMHFPVNVFNVLRIKLFYDSIKINSTFHWLDFVFTSNRILWRTENVKIGLHG